MGSLMAYPNPIIAVKSINILSTVVNGLGFSLLISSLTSSWSTTEPITDGTDSSDNLFFGRSPMAPNKGLANQNCSVPNSIKTPASPKPQDQPIFSARYPQSSIPKNAPAFTPI